MRKLFVFILVMSSTLGVFSQKSIDRLFEKYSGNEGFVTFTISGNLLQLFRSCSDDEMHQGLPAKVTAIRILAQDDDDIKIDNFFDKTMKDLDNNNYEEFMRVKESDQDMIMLVRAEGRRFREFLLIAGGENNLIIQVKGDMTLSEAHKFSSEMKKDCGRTLVSERN